MTGKTDVVTALVEAGARIDVLDLSGGSPLHTAAVHGHVPVVRYLWEKARRTLRDRSGWTILHLAAISGQQEVVKFLVDAGADWEASDRLGRNALHLAAIAGKELVVAFLLASSILTPSNMELKDRSGRTALHLAIEAGQTSMVKFLIENRADEEAQVFDTRPFEFAVSKGHEKIKQLQLQEGTDYRWEDATGDNLLHLASAGREPRLVEIFLEKGFHVESKGIFNASPLHCAARSGRVSNGKLLLAHNAKLEQKDIHGKTPLWYAVFHGRPSFVRLLLENGASTDVTPTGTNRSTPLFMAEKRKDKTIIYLLEHHTAARSAGTTTGTS
jgi:ankyrin repeat protein